MLSEYGNPDSSHLFEVAFPCSRISGDEVIEVRVTLKDVSVVRPFSLL